MSAFRYRTTLQMFGYSLLGQMERYKWSFKILIFSLKLGFLMYMRFAKEEAGVQ